MLTMPGNKGNASQNHTEIPSHPTKTPPTTNVGEDVEKKEPTSYTTCGTVS
jgi:hypothetical protein